MLLLEISDIQTLIETIGLEEFFHQLCQYLTEDFSRWHDFQKSPRHAFFVPNGVIELMPICNDELYSFKYVNGHPNNPQSQKLTVVALGLLADVVSGYPLMVSSMTLLTALRTASMSALMSRHLAKKDSKRLAIIGCGAQSEFQILAHHALFDLEEVRFFDIHPQSMDRLAKNLKHATFQLRPESNIQTAIDGADIIVTATAARGRQAIIRDEWVTNGQHISAIGGDSPGKTELDLELLKRAKLVVEFYPQTCHEGEIQNLHESAKDKVWAECWEIISGLKPGRMYNDEVTIFDSVGFALEDFSVLRLCYDLAIKHKLGKNIMLIPPELSDCKDLYGLLTQRLS